MKAGAFRNTLGFLTKDNSVCFQKMGIEFFDIPALTTAEGRKFRVIRRLSREREMGGKSTQPAVCPFDRDSAFFKSTVLIAKTTQERQGQKTT